MSFENLATSPEHDVESIPAINDEVGGYSWLNVLLQVIKHTWEMWVHRYYMWHVILEELHFNNYHM